jgi:ferredoxin
MWQLRVERTCIGSGSCQGVAPEHFALGDDHRSHPLVPQVDPDEAVLDAAASCPVEAITIVDLESGEVVDPG